MSEQKVQKSSDRQRGFFKNAVFAENFHFENCSTFTYLHRLWEYGNVTLKNMTYINNDVSKMISPQGMINLFDVYGDFVAADTRLENNKFGIGQLIGVLSYAKSISLFNLTIQNSFLNKDASIFNLQKVSSVVFKNSVIRNINFNAGQTKQGTIIRSTRENLQKFEIKNFLYENSEVSFMTFNGVSP